MTEAEKSASKTAGHPEGLPPETHNSEQADRDAQAQDVAADAQREDSHTASPLESTKHDDRNLDVAPSNKADLVDEMRRMEGEGRIDMAAFAGEPNHDDEPGAYGADATDNSDADPDAEWVVADGEDTAEETDLLDGEGLIEEVDREDGDRTSS